MFRQTKRRVAGRRNFEDVASYANATYPSRLTFYDLPPLEEITLEQFESWAIDRLRILIEIESCLARGKSLRETEAVVKPLLLKYLPTSSSGSDIVAERRKDYYSHYTLRLVFCRTDELRRKFVRNEVALFKIRYNLLHPKEQHDFVRAHAAMLQWEYIPAEEKAARADALYAALAPALRAALAADSDAALPALSADALRAHVRTTENFIRLPFAKVPQLVALRLVYMLRGYAYIPSTLQVSLLAVVFSERLSAALVKTFHALPRLEEDDRLMPLLAHLSRNFASVQYDGASEGVEGMTAAAVLTPAVTRHFPLCALRLLRALAADAHLKYGARQQLGLFLKGAGLGVDEALKFWAAQFTRTGKMNMDSFNKEYRYNFRHMYGLEGGRINYKPWDCNTILLKPKPQHGESHGCPYRDLSQDALVASLAEMGVSDPHDVNGVMEDVQKHDYTLACTRVFEITHKAQMTKPENLHITHPNLYFDRSRQLEKSEVRVE